MILRRPSARAVFGFACFVCMAFSAPAQARVFSVEATAARELEAKEIARREFATRVGDAYTTGESRASMLLSAGISFALETMRDKERWTATDTPGGRRVTLSMDLDLARLRADACAAVLKRWRTRVVLVSSDDRMVPVLERACVSVMRAPPGTSVMDALASASKTAAVPYLVADDGGARHMVADLIAVTSGRVLQRIPTTAAPEKMDWVATHFAARIGEDQVFAEDRALRQRAGELPPAFTIELRARDVPPAALDATLRMLTRGRARILGADPKAGTSTLQVDSADDPEEVAALLDGAAVDGRAIAVRIVNAKDGGRATWRFDVTFAEAAQDAKATSPRITVLGEAPVRFGDDRLADDAAEKDAQRKMLSAGLAITRPQLEPWIREWLVAAIRPAHVRFFVESEQERSVRLPGFSSGKIRSATFGANNLDALLCERVTTGTELADLEVAIDDAAMRAHFKRACFRMAPDLPARGRAGWRVDRRGPELVLIDARDSDMKTHSVVVKGAPSPGGSLAFVEAAVKHVTKMVRRGRAITLVVEGIDAMDVATAAAIREAITNAARAELRPSERAEAFDVEPADGVDWMVAGMQNLKEPGFTLDVVSSDAFDKQLVVVRVKKAK